MVLCGVNCWLGFQKLLDDVDWGRLIGVVDCVFSFMNILLFSRLRKRI